MKKFATFVVVFSVITFLLIQFPVPKAYANADEQAADESFINAQETIIELELGIEIAREYLQEIEGGEIAPEFVQETEEPEISREFQQEIEKSKTETDYEVAKQIIDNAEYILSEAEKYNTDASFLRESSDIAKDLNVTLTDTTVKAVHIASRATADTAQSYAKMGLLILRAPQFATLNELTCPDYPDIALWDKDASWRHIEMVAALADESFESANRALEAAAVEEEEDEEDEEDAENSIKAATECIALIRELNIHMETFEDICNEVNVELKDYKEFNDMEDDKYPSPV